MTRRYCSHFLPIMNDGNHVFVFGSNLNGTHGAGAAKAALLSWGARSGVGIGGFNQSYAIPTKAKWYDRHGLPLNDIKHHIEDFIAHTMAHPEITFLVTAIGTGLAGYTHAQIAPMFRDAPLNCVLPMEWKEFIEP